MSTATSKRPTPRRQPPRQRRLPVIRIAVGVIALLAIIAFVVSLGGKDDEDVGGGALQQTRPVIATGGPLVPLGDGDDPAVGESAPDLVGARFDGTPLRIGADGRPKVLVFLAHWCPHCQSEVPVLARWIADNGAPDEVDIYGVATSTTSDRPNFPPSAWLQREGFTSPTLADDAQGTAAEAFGLSAFPYFVAVNVDNHVVARTSGELAIPQWEALLDQAAERRR